MSATILDSVSRASDAASGRRHDELLWTTPQVPREDRWTGRLQGRIAAPPPLLDPQWPGEGEARDGFSFLGAAG
jgi:hypothetical protein